MKSAPPSTAPSPLPPFPPAYSGTPRSTPPWDSTLDIFENWNLAFLDCYYLLETSSFRRNTPCLCRMHACHPHPRLQLLAVSAASDVRFARRGR